MHIRSLAEAVHHLFSTRRLSARWQVVLSYSDPDNPDTTFSLEPEPAADLSLTALQADLRVMADELALIFWHICDALAARAS